VPLVRAGEHRDLLLDAHAAEQVLDPVLHGSSVARSSRRRFAARIAAGGAAVRMQPAAPLS
jgi:hypothetical protein